MILKINYKSTLPIYTQITEGIKNLIETGELKEGAILPSIRNLASQLDLSINTVARAYQDLERVGLIETGGRKGTFVRGGYKELRADLKIFKPIIRDLFLEGKSKEDIRGLFEEALNEIFE